MSERLGGWLNNAVNIGIIGLLYLLSGALVVVPLATFLAYRFGSSMGWLIFCLVSLVGGLLVVQLVAVIRMGRRDSQRIVDWQTKFAWSTGRWGDCSLIVMGAYLGPLVIPFVYRWMGLSQSKLRRLTVASSLIYGTIFYGVYGLGGRVLLDWLWGHG